MGEDEGKLQNPFLKGTSGSLPVFRDNTWVSSTGCLMFSFTSRFYDGPSLPCVQYLATLALIRAIRKHIFQVSADIIDLEPLKIKWPNDLYYGHSKVFKTNMLYSHVSS